LKQTSFFTLGQMMAGTRRACAWLPHCAVLLVVSAGLILVSSPASAQTNDLTVDVLINSTNTIGYNTSPTSPGEYQRYPERYLEHLQVPYRLIDVSNTQPPNNLGSVPLIIAGHRGLSLSSSWQQAILSAVQAGTGFINLDWDTTIGANAHMQAIFGSASSIAGTPGSSITIPANLLPDGTTPHYITGLQLRWPVGRPTSASGDLVYLFHQDDNGIVGTATATVLLNSQGAPISAGTVLAKINSDPLLTAATFGSGHAVNFGTYDYLRADRFGFVMGLDDLFWRSLVWAARKPFVLRGYPRYFANQQDDPVSGWDSRVGDMLNPAFTGAASTQTLSDGSNINIGGPWKVQGNIQTDDLDPGSSQRQNIINFISTTNSLRVSPHTVTGGSGGDLFWTGENPSPLTDAQWLANYNALLSFQKGAGPNGSLNGGNDFLPFSSHIIPHFWDFSNNIGSDLWNLGTRYITEIQMPGVYYSQVPAKSSGQRMPGFRPFRLYEQPPTNGDPNEIWSIYWADDYTLKSRAGQPAKTFFGFATQLQGAGYPTFDAVWPQAARGIPFNVALENWQAYAWRFWSSMAAVEIYNHDGGSMGNSTDQERQQFISTLSPWLAARSVQYIFMDDLGAYMRARVKSTLTSGTVSASTISLNLTGSATDMNGAPVATYAFVFYSNDNGQLIRVPGFTNGTSVSFPNVTPPTLGVNPGSLSFTAAPGGSNPQSQSLTVSNLGTGSLGWTANSSSSWLRVSPTSGTNAATLSASINISGLTVGTYTATIVVSAPAATNSPITVPVTLIVAPPTLSVNPTNLSFSAFQGQGNPSSQTLSIMNSGSGTVQWTASSSATWLTLSVSSGTAPSAVSVTANISGLALGVYNANITVSSSGATGSPKTIPVTLTLQGILLSDNFSSGSMEGLAVSPLGLASNWSVSPGILRYNGNGPTQLYAGNAAWTDYNYQVTFQLSSLADYPGGIRARINPATGAGYALWFYPNEKIVKLFRNVAWNIDSGVTLLGQAAVSFDTAAHTVSLSFQGSQIQVFYDNAPLVSVADSGSAGGMVGLDVSNKPIAFTNLLVTGTNAAVSSLNPSASTLTFSGNFQGPNPAAQSLNLFSSGGALAWTAITTVPWLQVSPTNGATNSSLQVTANTQNLAGGTYSGQVRITSLAAANNPQVINVNLTVVLPPPTLSLTAQGMSFTAISGQTSPPAQLVTIANAGSGSIAWTAATDAPWLSVSSSSGGTPSQINVSVNGNGLALGSYVGHVTVSANGVVNSPQVISVNLRELAQALNENFSNSAAGWVISPLGHANGWSVASNIYTYSGFGNSQACAGNANWGDYVLDAGVRFSSLANYPGGLRARVNPTTGAGYALWFYPGSGLVKLFRVGQWNIDSGATLLAQAAMSFDTLNFHDARMDFQGSQIKIYWDGALLMNVNDTTYATGNVCLEGSNQPISYNGVTVLANQFPALLSASPNSLSFAASNLTNPPNQTVSIAAGGAATEWAVTSDSSWLSATASSSITPGLVTVAVNAAGLASGTYTGSLKINSPGANNSPLTIPVTLSVQSGLLTASPTSLVFFGAVGFNPVGQSVTIANQGTGQASWSASSGAPWDSLSPLTGTAPGMTVVTPNVTATGLSAGRYSDTVSLSSAQTPNIVSVPVTLNVGTLLFNDDFSSGATNWTVSPLGSPSNWSVVAGSYNNSGGGISNSSAGSQSWTNYNYSADFHLSSLNDFPGGIRGRVNLTNGAGYGAWIYPNEKLIKLFRIPQWNIDAGGSVVLAQSNTISIDAMNWHNLRVDFNGSTITVYFDNAAVVSANDATYSAGAIALDVSNQPIQFRNVIVIGY
jgi:hypothetical protein